jgi:hypothetical protein
MNFEKRILRIYPKYVYRKYSPSAFVSEIRLKGNWLHDWGFQIGEFIKVKRLHKGVLIIKNNSAEVPIIEL